MKKEITHTETIGTGFTRRKLVFRFPRRTRRWAEQQRREHEEIKSGKLWPFDRDVLRMLERNAWAELTKAGLTRKALRAELRKLGIHGKTSEMDLISASLSVTGIDKIDSKEGYAARLLSRIQELRLLKDRGETRLAIEEAFQIGTLAMEAAMKFPLERRFLHFLTGPKKSRLDATKRVILAAMRSFPEPVAAKAKDVWARIESSTDASAILGMDFHVFETKVSRLKKRYFPKK